MSRLTKVIQILKVDILGYNNNQSYKKIKCKISRYGRRILFGYRRDYFLL